MLANWFILFYCKLLTVSEFQKKIISFQQWQDVSYRSITVFYLIRSVPDCMKSLYWAGRNPQRNDLTTNILGNIPSST